MENGATPVWPGWTAAGLLAAVLLWLGKSYLPAKDQQIERLINLLLNESEKNRMLYEQLIVRLEQLCKQRDNE